MGGAESSYLNPRDTWQEGAVCKGATRARSATPAAISQDFLSLRLPCRVADDHK